MNRQGPVKPADRPFVAAGNGGKLRPNSVDQLLKLAADGIPDRFQMLTSL
jgi:hypothetical protein